MSRGVQLIKDRIASKKVVVVSKSWCGFCRMAKGTLKKYNIRPEDIEVIEIDGLDDCGDIQNYMGKVTGGTSVSKVLYLVSVILDLVIFGQLYKVRHSL